MKNYFTALLRKFWTDANRQQKTWHLFVVFGIIFGLIYFHIGFYERRTGKNVSLPELEYFTMMLSIGSVLFSNANQDSDNKSVSHKASTEVAFESSSDVAGDTPQEQKRPQ